MKVEIVTLFPDMFTALTENGITGRAVSKGLAAIGCINPRDHTQDVHRTVDDRPYGGGPGMLMLAEPLLKAVAEAKQRLAAQGVVAPKVVYASPQGRSFDQSVAQELSEAAGVVFICGRYEGIDERVIELVVDEEWSIGDFVVSGGELPVMTMIDAAVRLLPGALGHQSSADEDSFAGQLLDCPHYTRPECYQGLAVPSVLLSGHHGEIKRWRLQQSLGRTWLRRPDLLAKKPLSADEQRLLNEYLDEQGLS